MGYRSDVRIRLTKIDFERLKLEFENKIVNELGYDNLFDTMDAYKNVGSAYCYNCIDTDGNTKKDLDCVFFGWNCVKWYEGYKDVDFIMDFIQKCERYAFCRIGESLEGDIECHEQGMEMIGFYYAFDEEE